MNTNAGFALRYPADVFALAGADVEDQERLLLSKDRRAVLRKEAEKAEIYFGGHAECVRFVREEVCSVLKNLGGS